MEESEKKIMQEDCSEDSLGIGVLTLTNMRVAFDKTKGRIADFSKKIGDTVLDVKLNQIVEVGKEGWLITKVRIKINTDEGEKTYKFGVFNTGKWLKAIQDAIPAQKN
ncbi:MAG: hypothetical protein E6L05_00050 [Thaumarchaeota archaeon]|nr:MAG: hypothetical protein E6L05_00050 [Nitrososphaerota archaeon]